jgi:hypothetical protein
MRPDPPAPDTPNDGRKRKYSPLVEPYEPEKLQRREIALLAGVAGAVGAVLVVGAQVALGALL